MGQPPKVEEYQDREVGCPPEEGLVKSPHVLCHADLSEAWMWFLTTIPGSPPTSECGPDRSLSQAGCPESTFPHPQHTGRKRGLQTNPSSTLSACPSPQNSLHTDSFEIGFLNLLCSSGGSGGQKRTDLSLNRAGDEEGLMDR